MNCPLFALYSLITTNAVVCIFLAVDLDKAAIPYWVNWLLVAYVAVHAASHLVLSVPIYLAVCCPVSNLTTRFPFSWPNVVITPMEAESRRPYLLCVIWPLTRAIRTISTRRSRTRRKMLM